MYSYVSSFGVVMNEDFWNKLPPDLQALVTKSMTGVEKEVGEAWDGLDVPGKKLLIDGGAEAIKLSPEENAKFRKIGAEVAEAQGQGARGQGHAGARDLRHDEVARREARQDLEEFLELSASTRSARGAADAARPYAIALRGPESAVKRWRDRCSLVCGVMAAVCPRRR